MQLKPSTNNAQVEDAIDLLTTGHDFRDLQLSGNYTQPQVNVIVNAWRQLPAYATVFSIHAPGDGQIKAKPRVKYTDVNATLCTYVGKLKNIIHVNPTKEVGQQLLKQ